MGAGVSFLLWSLCTTAGLWKVYRRPLAIWGKHYIVWSHREPQYRTGSRGGNRHKRGEEGESLKSKLLETTTVPRDLFGAAHSRSWERASVKNIVRLLRSQAHNNITSLHRNQKSNGLPTPSELPPWAVLTRCTTWLLNPAIAVL